MKLGLQAEHQIITCLGVAILYLSCVSAKEGCVLWNGICVRPCQILPCQDIRQFSCGASRAGDNEKRSEGGMEPNIKSRDRGGCQHPLPCSNQPPRNQPLNFTSKKSVNPQTSWKEHGDSIS